jgi:hypothetical protein
VFRPTLDETLELAASTWISREAVQMVRCYGHDPVEQGVVYSRLHRTSYSISYLVVGERGALTVVERRGEAIDHIGAIYEVYIHGESITVTAV